MPGTVTERAQRLLAAAALLLILALPAPDGVRAAPAEAVQAWDLLRLAEVSEQGEGENWRAIKIIPDALFEAAEGFTVTGYLVPIMAEAELTTFLLVEQPENCPFCGNGGYGPVLEVTMARPLPDLPEFTRITLEGQLSFNEDPYTFQLYRLEQARRIEDGF